MKNRKLQALLGSGLAALAWVANAQSQSNEHGIPQNGEPLRRSEGGQPLIDQERPSPFDAESWKESLSEGNLDRRQASYEELLQIARRDPAARQAIEEWSQGSDELAWTSRLALRELQRQPPSNRQRLQSGPLRQDDLGSWFETPFGGLGANHRQLFEDLERKLDTLFGQQPGTNLVPVPQSPSDPNVQSQGQSFRLESTPDGVKVHVEERHDGNLETREYEAKDMQDLLERYPELREHISTQPLVPGDVRGELGGLLERLRGMHQRGWQDDGSTDLQPQLDARPQVPTDVLGVYISGPAQPGDGLLVERIEPGTIAQAIGIQRGDVLIEINGTPLTDSADVSRVLRAREADQELDVKLRDRRGEERTLTWKPKGLREL